MKRKKKQNFEIARPLIAFIGFLIPIFLVNSTEKNYSLNLENAVNIFSSGILIVTNTSKGFSILLAFLLLLVPALLFLHLLNGYKK